MAKLIHIYLEGGVFLHCGIKKSETIVERVTTHLVLVLPDWYQVERNARLHNPRELLGPPPTLDDPIIPPYSTTFHHARPITVSFSLSLVRGHSTSLTLGGANRI